LPDERKGESLGCVVVVGPGVVPDGALRDELSKVVTDELGKAFRPSVVAFTKALPKTRNAKVLRRAIRAAATGTDPGDLSALEDPSAIEAVRVAHARAAGRDR
jgi:acetyl-CoA synthetase